MISMYFTIETGNYGVERLVATFEDEFMSEDYKPEHRVKVLIRCKECGERFVLRAVRDDWGNWGTSFRMCVCGNVHDLDIEQVKTH